MQDSPSHPEPTAFELLDFEHPTVKLPPLLSTDDTRDHERVTAPSPPATVRRAVNRNTERPNGPFDPSPPPDTAWALPVPEHQPMLDISPDPQELSWVSKQLDGVLACHEKAVVQARAGAPDPYAELRTALLEFVQGVGEIAEVEQAKAA